MAQDHPLLYPLFQVAESLEVPFLQAQANDSGGLWTFRQKPLNKPARIYFRIRIVDETEHSNSLHKIRGLSLDSDQHRVFMEKMAEEHPGQPGCGLSAVRPDFVRCRDLFSGEP